jgi:hypothetical protein
LLRDPPQNPFSTVSVSNGHPVVGRVTSALPRITDVRPRRWSFRQLVKKCIFLNELAIHRCASCSIGGHVRSYAKKRYYLSIVARQCVPILLQKSAIE